MHLSRRYNPISTHSLILRQAGFMMVSQLLKSIVLILLAAGAGWPGGSDSRPVHTYSIVARDSATGEMGVAVQSHWFSVGSIVTWAEAGVGAIATQSFADPAYGPRGLALMGSGMTAEEALSSLLDADEGEAVRQIAFVDQRGNVAGHTGSGCIESAGQIFGPGYSVQANMMITDAIVPAMAEAYVKSGGDLAERMMAALEAAQEAGGDIRGKQSAAMLIVRGVNTGRPWVDTVLELRVEDHAEPVRELRRVLTVHRAYEEMNQGDIAMEEGEMARASRHYENAARMNPGNVEILFWQGITLATTGHLEEARPLLRRVFAIDPQWAELVPRLVKPGLIPDTPEGRELIREILKEGDR